LVPVLPTEPVTATIFAGRRARERARDIVQRAEQSGTRSSGASCGIAASSRAHDASRPAV
jgi:hypothetical protein